MSDTSTNRQDSDTNSSHRLNSTELSELYPTPKTYEQKQAEQKDRELRILARQPRHLALSTALRLFTLTCLGALLLSMVPAIILTNVLSGVSTVALLAIILMGITWWQVNEIASAFYLKGVNEKSFLIVYLLTVAPLMITMLYHINTNLYGVYVGMSYAGLFLLHLASVYGLLHYITKQQN